MVEDLGGESLEGELGPVVENRVKVDVNSDRSRNQEALHLPPVVPTSEMMVVWMVVAY